MDILTVYEYIVYDTYCRSCKPSPTSEHSSFLCLFVEFKKEGKTDQAFISTGIMDCLRTIF